MPGSLSDSPAAHIRALRQQLATSQWPPSRRLALLALNVLPLAHLATVGLFALWPGAAWNWRLIGSATALYLFPPLLARLIRLLWKIPQGKVSVGSEPFFAWWAVFQLQIIFSRLPQLEEILRLVPGAYSLWLRCWGARVGKLTFWSPGTLILDRPFLSVGDHVIFGAGVHVNPHVIMKNPRGELDLILGTVKIGDRALVGGYSLLTAGAEIAPDEETKALTVLPPFSVWKEGKRARPNPQDEHG